MKKKSLLMMMLLCFALFGVARAQSELTVFDGTNANSNVPFYGLYADTEGAASECVIPSDELGEMTGGTISAIKFYISTAAGEAWTGTHQVYLGEVDATTLTGITGPDAYTVVKTASFDATGTELTIEFDEPYVYGGGNLLIGTYVSVAGNWKSAYFYGVNQEENTGWYRNSGTVTGSGVKFLPKTTFTYTSGGGPVCLKPKNIAIEYNGGTTATVTWTGDASQYNIDVNGTVTNNVSSPYTLTGLQLATTYTVKLQSNCGGGLLSDWTGGNSFSTDICMPEDQCNLTFVLTDTYGDSWNGNAIKVTDVATGIVVATLANQNLDGVNGEETQTVTLAVCDGRALEFSWVAGSYPGETQYTVTDINNEVVLEGSGAFETFTFTPNCTPVTCARPEGLEVTYEGGTTAEVAWVSDATSFNIDVNGTVTEGVSNPYTLTGLDLATTYTVMVQANCGADGLSNWTAPVSFNTDLCLPEDMCAITLDLVDSYGDGWNGAALQVYDYDETAEELTLLSQFTLGSGTSEGSFTLNVCTGRILVFYWSAGSYDSECSYAVYDNLGDKIFSGSGAMTDYEVFEMNCNSTCRTPTNFAASNVSGFSAELSWTENGEATSWTMAYMAAADTDVSYVENITANPYLFEGLTPNTTYYAMIKADCEDAEKWSDVITFTTTDPCPKPVVTVDPTTNSATVTWTGFSESYDLEWTVQPTSKDPYSEEGWYYYDNGTYVGSVGLGGGQFYWGVMFPAGSFEGSLLSTVRAYDINAMVGELIIYNDGDAAPGNEISRQNMEFTGANDWVEFATNVVVDPTKNVWVVFNAADGAAYPIGTSNDDNGDANGRWVEISGTWYDMASVGVEGRANMIRAHFEPGYDPSELNWTSVPGATSPYVIEGLEPETTYIVRVMGHCGDDGDSNWTTVTFSTVALCATPINLVAEPSATSAELSWSNYQESYNLYYRYRLPGDPTAPATVILTAPDIWGDGSGYQMLLDADATAYGTIIPTTGALTSGGDVSDEIYAEFEYKIPVHADGALTTENIVINNSIAIEIPAGTYDWCITNPTPGDRMWIAAANGIGGRYDDFVFEAGKTYEFTVAKYGSNDGVDLFVGPMSDWTVLDNVTTPYTLTGLTPNTYYEWKVEGVNKSCEGGVTEQSEVQNFTTLEAPSTVEQTLELSAGWTWMSVYLEASDELFEAIKDGIAENNTTAMIKDDKGGSLMLQGANGWQGELDFINEGMYMTNFGTPVTLNLTAAPADPAAHPITIATGWNWIGFISSEPMTVEEAMSNITPNNDDLIKSTDGSWTYSAGSWVGELPAMEPGQGYMYYNRGAEMTLVYPASAKGVVRSIPMEKYWSTNVHEHATNLVVMATLDESQFAMAEGNYEIGAFVNGECRGSSRLLKTSNGYVALVLVHGEYDETISFKLYDVTNAMVAGSSEEQLRYVANAIVGSVEEPMVLHFRGVTDVNEEGNSLSMFPNPTKDNVKIQGQAIETVSVYNALGQCLINENYGNATDLELNLSGLSAGVYTVSIRTNGTVINKLVVKE